jgi:uncharacterized OsmC-like protein
VLVKLAGVGCDKNGGMDVEELKSVQTPLKDKYRADASAARLTLHASGRLGDEAIACSVDTGRAMVEAGLHPMTGGDGSFACSGDMLLQALVACAGVTLRSVATSMGIPVSGSVRAEGDLDFRGTLGVDPEAPVGFADIRLIFHLESDAEDERIAKLIEVTERYCVVLQTLRQPPPVVALRA